MYHRAFGWDPPIYGHLPLILNADGSKLSKRQGDIKIESFRKQGIFPLALLNYVIGAGGGFHGEKENQNLYSYQELIKRVKMLSHIKLLLYTNKIFIAFYIYFIFCYSLTLVKSNQVLVNSCLKNSWNLINWK